MEWGHRILGRVIGVVFVAPLAYFAIRKKLTASLPVRLTCMAGLIGFQGFLGWYMVKSGLEQSLLDTPGAVPRVSQYRLSAHLGTALVLYAGMLSTGLAVIRDWKYANGGLWSGTKASTWQHILGNHLVKSFTRQSWALSILVLLTAISGMQLVTIHIRFFFSEQSQAHSWLV
jgi:heme a synthase